MNLIADFGKLAEFLEDPATHLAIVGPEYDRGYSLGIGAENSKIVLRLQVVGDTAGFPSSIMFDGQELPIVVENGYIPPSPL